MLKSDRTNYDERMKEEIYNQGCNMSFILSVIPESVKKKIAICIDRKSNPSKYSFRTLAEIHGFSHGRIEQICKECNKFSLTT